MYIKSDSQMYAHKKARHVVDRAPGLETQNVVPQCGTITLKVVPSTYISLQVKERSE